MGSVPRERILVVGDELPFLDSVRDNREGEQINVSDPFELPVVRVRTPEDVGPSRPRSVPDQPTESLRRVEEPNADETRGERLARLWIKYWDIRREAERRLKALRGEIEQALADGESVRHTTGRVSWRTSTVVKADPSGLFAAVGPDVYVRASDVSATKLRELIEAGLVPADAPYLTTESVRRLVTEPT